MGESLLTRRSGKNSARYAWQVFDVIAAPAATPTTVYTGPNDSNSYPIYKADTVSINPDGTVNLVDPITTSFRPDTGINLDPASYYCLSGTTNLSPSSVFKYNGSESSTMAYIYGLVLELTAGSTLGAVISNLATKYPDDARVGDKFYKKVVV